MATRVQRAYRAGVMRFVLRQLKAIRCIPLAFSLAGMALNPVKGFYQDMVLEEYQQALERIVYLTASLYEQSNVWVQKVFEHFSVEADGGGAKVLGLKILEQTFKAARVCPCSCVSHCACVRACVRSSACVLTCARIFVR